MRFKTGISALSFLAACCSFSSAETITAISAAPGTGADSDKRVLSFSATVQPGIAYLMEASPDLLTWGPASGPLSSTGSLLTWQTKECNETARRYYRLSRPPAGYSTAAPTGRLTSPSAGNFALTTTGNWSIALNSASLKVTHPNAQYYYEFWGSTHENLKGKHIKDLLGDRRTLLLADNTQITITIDRSLIPGATVPMGAVTYISIYDGNQSHRINMQALQIDRSGPIARYGEAAEPDGEAGRLIETVDGLLFENIYTEPETCSGPAVRVFETVPLGQLYLANPSLVRDYFDDPRIGHT